MRGAVAERRRADFDIPAPLPRVCSHIRGADAEWTRADLPFLEDSDGLERAVSKRTRQIDWVLDPFLAERILLPLRLRSATAHVWTHVMICVEANFTPASARVRPRMCERTLTSQLSKMADRTGCLVPLLTYTDRINPFQHGKYHGCWCPSSSCRQVTSM